MFVLQNHTIHVHEISSQIFLEFIQVSTLTLFEEGEAIPLFEEGGDKFVLHPKKTKSLEKK